MDIKVFTGTSNVPLATKICQELGINLGECFHHTFPSGEDYCQLQENIRGADVFIIQSVCNPANARFMQLCTMIDAAKRASAGRITVVTPYLGYLRQDRKDKPRVPITARAIADLLVSMGINRVLGMDFHCPQAQGFFPASVPVDHLYALPVFVDYIKSLKVDGNVVISTADLGGIKRVRAFSKSLGCPMAIVVKERLSDTEVEAQDVIGDVEGKDVFISDDLTESCGTAIAAAEQLKNRGAKSVRAFITHALLTGVGYSRLRNNKALDELVVTDTVHTSPPVTVMSGDGGQTAKVVMPGDGLNIKTLSVAPLFARAISCIHNNESVSGLFSVKGY